MAKTHLGSLPRFTILQLFSGLLSCFNIDSKLDACLQDPLDKIKPKPIGPTSLPLIMHPYAICVCMLICIYCNLLHGFNRKPQEWTALPTSHHAKAQDSPSWPKPTNYPPRIAFNHANFFNHTQKHRHFVYQVSVFHPMFFYNQADQGSLPLDVPPVLLFSSLRSVRETTEASRPRRRKRTVGAFGARGHMQKGIKKITTFGIMNHVDVYILIGARRTGRSPYFNTHPCRIIQSTFQKRQLSAKQQMLGLSLTKTVLPLLHNPLKQPLLGLTACSVLWHNDIVILSISTFSCTTPGSPPMVRSQTEVLLPISRR